MYPRKGCSAGQCLEISRDTCDCADKDWPRISELQFDALHRLILDLSRCDCAAFSCNDARCIDFGLHAAMDLLGMDEGPVLFGRILALSKAVRLERAGTFDFLTIRCTRITPDERYYMAAVQAARHPRDAEVSACAVRLVRNVRCAATVRALDNLGETCRRIDWFNTSPVRAGEEDRIVH